MSTNTKGHRANAPGLRGHSCGDLYPLTIVGTNFGRSWYVLDCISGHTSPYVRRSQKRAERDAQLTLALRRCEAIADRVQFAQAREYHAKEN